MQKVLILGANGSLGRHLVRSFSSEGWEVRAHIRSGATPKHLQSAQFEKPDTIKVCPVDIEDREAMAALAEDCAVIVNALNPPYGKWVRSVPLITAAVLRIARSSGATVLFPGNVYNYGSTMPEVLDDKTPHRADARLGKIRVETEQAYRKASEEGVQVIILRLGDFLMAEPNGNWFDSQMIGGLDKGRIVYPGDPNVAHAWAYLPDAARAIEQLASIREDLPVWSDIPYSGTTLTGSKLTALISKSLNRPIKISGLPWWLLKCIAPFNANLRGVLEMRYLWDVPHELDGAAFEAALPGFVRTSDEEVVMRCLGDRVGVKTQ